MGPILGLALAAAWASESQAYCEPIVAERTIWSNSRVSPSLAHPVPGQPWCLNMATPGKGYLDIEFYHAAGPVARWTLVVAGTDGRVLMTCELDEPDVRRARIQTKVLVEPPDDHVLLTVTGAGTAFDLSVVFVPIPPTLQSVHLPDGSLATSVHRGDTLVLHGTDFADHPDTRVHAGGVRIVPDEIEADRVEFRVPARAHDNSLFVDGPSGMSDRILLPLVDPDPGPPFGVPRLPTEDQVAVDVFADPNWSAAQLQARVDEALAGCGLSTAWSVQGYSLTISLFTLHAQVPPGQAAEGYGQRVVGCLGAALDVGVGGLVVGTSGR